MKIKMLSILDFYLTGLALGHDEGSNRTPVRVYIIINHFYVPKHHYSGGKVQEVFLYYAPNLHTFQEFLKVDTRDYFSSDSDSWLQRGYF